ncbi:c-type cytochrome [Ottowia sp. GY511]|uniref:C-type cytochrome n=1 Tax=Ottowia flava TaxID=2675430 RepID=A0ABW4KTW1_9BURK|nr:c-type cytochrome [Ottowia sp. GY511]TXK23575.1 c-type cytochrome [Ottowia sp. GY511]
MSTADWAVLGGLMGVSAFACAAPATLLGAQIYERCVACHALAQDRVGPHHCGLMGRRAGSVPGFSYTTAMKASGLTWDVKTLDRFLSHPTQVVPGTSMTYDGVADPKERQALIDYLQRANDTPECRALAASARR